MLQAREQLLRVVEEIGQMTMSPLRLMRSPAREKSVPCPSFAPAQCCSVREARDANARAMPMRHEFFDLVVKQHHCRPNPAGDQQIRQAGGDVAGVFEFADVAGRGVFHRLAGIHQD